MLKRIGMKALGILAQGARGPHGVLSMAAYVTTLTCAILVTGWAASDTDNGVPYDDMLRGYLDSLSNTP